MCIKRDVYISSPSATFYRADTFYLQYVNETTQKLYPIPFLPLAIG